jgi:hypothetical protein
MIQISVEVREGGAPFRVAVQAESIGTAVGIVEERYPGSDLRVVFPIDPEEYFLEGSERPGRDRMTAESFGRFADLRRDADSRQRNAPGPTKE